MSHVALSEEVRKRVLLLMVGQDDNPEARLQVDALWTKYSARAYIYPDLLDLYVRRDLLFHLIGNSLGLVDWKWDAVEQKDSQAMKNWLDLWKATLEEIALLLKQIRSARAAQVGLITATAPSPPPFGVDANHPVFRGSPYYRRSGCW
jgi:hypothetical protein